MPISLACSSSRLLAPSMPPMNRSMPYGCTSAATRLIFARSYRGDATGCSLECNSSFLADPGGEAWCGGQDCAAVLEPAKLEERGNDTASLFDQQQAGKAIPGMHVQLGVGVRPSVGDVGEA